MPAVAVPISSVVPRGHNPTYGRPSYRPVDVRVLLKQAQQGLLDAEYAANPVDRYVQAYLAALRAAAAVLAARDRPRRRAQPTNAWVLLASAAPELAEWSRFFATSSAVRTAAEAGVRHLVTTREADDLVRQAGAFLTVARETAARTSR